MASGMEARRIRSAAPGPGSATPATHRTLARPSAVIGRHGVSDFVWPEERVGLQGSSPKWWLFLALGIMAIVVGAILLLDLVAAAATLALLVALGFGVTGVSEIISATDPRKQVRG